jgi:hypothetical protein
MSDTNSTNTVADYPTELAKRCSKCFVVKPLASFGNYTSPRTGKIYPRSACKSCVRIAVAKRMREWRKNNPGKRREGKRRTEMKCRYGMAPSDYEAILERQGGVCAICKGVQTRKQKRHLNPGQPDILHIDHDHATGKVRGLLCHCCNMLIGHARENAATLMAAIVYLEYHRKGDENGQL